MREDWWWLVSDWLMTDEHQQSLLTTNGKRKMTDKDWWWTLLNSPFSSPGERWQILDERWEETAGSWLLWTYGT